MALSVPATEDALTAQGYELGVKQRGNFLGLSIELSVADQISKAFVNLACCDEVSSRLSTMLVGKNPVNLKVPFLNYLGNIRNRAGMGPLGRVGGNSQEASTLYPDGFDNHMIIEKVKVDGVSEWIAESTYTTLTSTCRGCRLSRQQSTIRPTSST